MEARRFACDAMLGGLARWLRFAGFDTLFDPHVLPARLAARARAEDRWLLTRQRAFPVAFAGPRIVILSRRKIEDQIAELVERIGLVANGTFFFSRCSRCNGEISEIARDEVKDKVPPYVVVHAQRFLRCAACGQIYWPGTHHVRIAQKLVELFASNPSHSSEKHGVG